MSKIIIEGVCATGKSLLFKELSRSEEYLEKQTKIQLSEYLTERIIENLNPTVEERVSLLEGYVDIFERIHNNFYNSRFKNTKSPRVKPAFLIERFHLTHAVEVSDFNPFKEIDERLNAMGFELIILTMKKDIFKERLEDTFSRRPKTWYNYIMSFGGLEGACKRYISMQEKLLEYASLTKLPTKIRDTGDGSFCPKI